MGGSYIRAMGDEEYDIIKDFFIGNFNVPVAVTKECIYKILEIAKRTFYRPWGQFSIWKKENR